MDNATNNTPDEMTREPTQDRDELDSDQEQFKAFEEHVGRDPERLVALLKQTGSDDAKTMLTDVWSGLPEDYKALWVSSTSQAVDLLQVYAPQLSAAHKAYAPLQRQKSAVQQKPSQYAAACLWKEITSICPGFEAFKDHFYHHLESNHIVMKKRRGVKFHKMFLVTVFLGLTEPQQRQWALQPNQANFDQDHLFKDLEDAMVSFDSMTGFASMIDKRSTAYLQEIIEKLRGLPFMAELPPAGEPIANQAAKDVPMPLQTAPLQEQVLPQYTPRKRGRPKSKPSKENTELLLTQSIQAEDHENPQTNALMDLSKIQNCIKALELNSDLPEANRRQKFTEIVATVLLS